MIKHFNVSGDTRKKLVKLISSHLGVESRYLGAPSFAYSIGNYTVNKDGSLSWDEDDERTAGLLEAIKAEGFSATEADETEEEVLVEEEMEEEAEANRLKVAAGLTPQERAEWEYKTKVGVAEALSKTKWPTIVMSGNQGGGSNAMDVIALKQMTDLVDKMSK